MTEPQIRLTVPRLRKKIRFGNWWRKFAFFWNKLGVWGKSIVSILPLLFPLFYLALQYEEYRPQVQFTVSDGKELIRCKFTNVGKFPLRNFNATVGYTELNTGQWSVSKPYSLHQDVLDKDGANSREMEMEVEGSNPNRTLLVFALLASDRFFYIGPRIDTAKFRLLFQGKEWSEPSYDLRQLGERDRPVVRKLMVDFDPRFDPYLVEKIYPNRTSVCSSTLSEPVAIEVLRTNQDASIPLGPIKTFAQPKAK